MPKEYVDMSNRLLELAKTQKGFRRIESVADQSGNGISVSYWESLESIQAWKENSVHLHAQMRGKTEWYNYYQVEICQIIRSYEKADEK